MLFVFSVPPGIFGDFDIYDFEGADPYLILKKAGPDFDQEDSRWICTSASTLIYKQKVR